MSFQIQNRRYTGSKYKLKDWILQLVQAHCKGASFCELFAGTGVISATARHYYDTIIINDLLYSNFLIYQAFFLDESYNKQIINDFARYFQSVVPHQIDDNYFSQSFGKKFFSQDDAKRIGFIRETIEAQKSQLNTKEYTILLASLLYSTDKSANTVGHYDAFFHKPTIKDRFQFELVNPFKLKTNQKIFLYREDANSLAKKVHCDVVYIDPPYNSRQYSRFYHLLENLTQWKKPTLTGVALKPPTENMSDYCRINAPKVFHALIRDLQCIYIIVSYNNTYYSKSNSSKNKITLDQIQSMLTDYGKVQIFEKKHPFFNTGKTNFVEHKEYIFILKKG